MGGKGGYYVANNKVILPSRPGACYVRIIFPLFTPFHPLISPYVSPLSPSSFPRFTPVLPLFSPYFLLIFLILSLFSTINFPYYGIILTPCFPPCFPLVPLLIPS